MAADLDQRVVGLTNVSGVSYSPIDPARPCGARMKGFPLLHLLDLMDQTGPGLAAEWRGTLPASLQASTERRAVTSVAWLPVEFYFHGVEWMATHHYQNVRGGIQVGHFTASQDIGAFFRFVMSMTSPATVMQLSGRFWKSYFDVSSLHVIKSEPGMCIAEIRDWPLMNEASLYEMGGSLVAWMEASRAHDVRVPRLELIKPGVMALEARWS
jgi:hypothetical protein